MTLRPPTEVELQALTEELGSEFSSDERRTIYRGGFVDRRGRFLLSAREAGVYLVRAGRDEREILVSRRNFAADGQSYRIEQTDWR